MELTSKSAFVDIFPVCFVVNCYMLIFFPCDLNFLSMGLEFPVFKFRDFLTIGINAKLKTREINYQ